MRYVAIACAPVVVGIAIGAARADLVANGNFETGTFTGWTQFGDTSLSDVSALTAHSGVWAGRFGPSSLGGIQQQLFVSAGTQVEVNFWYEAQGGQNSFEAKLGGHVLASYTNDLSHATWSQLIFPVTVDTNNPILKFTFFNPPSYDFIDDVQVTVLPAPASFGLLGMAGIIAGRRRRIR